MEFIVVRIVVFGKIGLNISETNQEGWDGIW